MNRSSIIALAIFAAILAYFLSFGAESTRKLQAGFYSLISPFLKTGSGLQKSITSVSTGLKTLDEVERENAALKVENRSLKATNQALRDVEHEVNRLRRALDYRAALGLPARARGNRGARFIDLVADGDDQSGKKRSHRKRHAGGDRRRARREDDHGR